MPAGEGRIRYYEVLAWVKTLPLEYIESEEPPTLRATAVNAENRLSLGDAFNAATAAVMEGALVHKDPEFEQLSDTVPLRPLLHKPKKQSPKAPSPPVTMISTGTKSLSGRCCEAWKDHEFLLPPINHRTRGSPRRMRQTFEPGEVGTPWMPWS